MITIKNLNAKEVAKHADFNNVQSIDELTSYILELSETTHPNDKNAQARLKGAAFEVFVEYLLKHNTNLGIYNYSPNVKTDHGVDGFGANEDIKNITVQIKFRNNLELEHSGLSNFTTSSAKDYDVNDKNCKIVITNCKSLSDKTYSKVLTFIGHADLVNATNKLFWKEFNLHMDKLHKIETTNNKIIANNILNSTKTLFVAPGEVIWKLRNNISVKEKVKDELVGGMYRYIKVSAGSKTYTYDLTVDKLGNIWQDALSKSYIIKLIKTQHIPFKQKSNNYSDSVET